MDFNNIKHPQSHGSGNYKLSEFKHLGKNVLLEKGILIFHPENISLFDNVYVGHGSILKAYYLNEMIIGEGSWIGQNCFFHSAGGIRIGKCVGIGPCVKIITSYHKENKMELPVLHNPLEFKPVEISDGADIGVGTIILPGLSIGEGAIVGAGSVVTKNIEAYSVYAGVPAKRMRQRNKA